MKALIVGGAGFVGSIVMPYLKEEHEIRVFDLKPSEDSSVDYVRGSVHDLPAIHRALDGIEGVIYMAMGRTPEGAYAIEDIGLNYDLNVKGLHRVLHAAATAGVKRAVYVSTTDVHRPLPDRIYDTETMPYDATCLYGFTKGLGEVVCEHIARAYDLSVIALRVHMPMTQEEWHRTYRPGPPHANTAAPDLARALSLSLSAPLTGFHAVFISGDYEGKIINCAKAKELLGWEPQTAEPRSITEIPFEE